MYKLGNDIIRWQTKSFLPSSPTEHQFWQLPTDQNTFVGVWESSTFLEQKKKSQNRFIEEGKKNSFTLSASPIPQEGTVQWPERLPWMQFLPEEKARV